VGTDNYVRWSEAFWTWSEGFATVSNIAFDFFGSPAALKLTESRTYSWHYMQESPTSFDPEDYTFSIWAKVGERDLLKLVSSWPTVYDGMAIFDLTNGQIIEGDGTMVDDGDGWYRCSISSSIINRSPFNIRCMICTLDSDGDVTDDYEGDGKSGLYLAKAQWNEGLDVETYAKTEGWPK